MQFNISISSDATKSPDSGQLTDAERQEVVNTMTAAATIWSWYLTAANVTLDLSINIDSSAYSGLVLAKGGAGGYYTGASVPTFQGAKVYYPVSEIKLGTSQDPNGASPDLSVTLTPDAIRNILYFNPNVAPTVASYSVPSNQADSLSVFLHEIGHGLGITSLSK